MSVMGVKKTLVDVWPIRNKRHLVLVDSNSLVDTTSRGLCTSIPTIASITAAKGRVIVMASFGDFQGVDIAMPAHRRQDALEHWRWDEGLGLTNYFASLDGKSKLEVLRRNRVEVSKDCTTAAGTGKSRIFAKLPAEQKRKIIEEILAERHAKVVNLSTRSMVQLLQDAVPSATSVNFVEDPINAAEAVRTMEPGAILVMENLRFYANETSPNYDERHAFGEILASYGDVFVNDSFSTSYRALASNEIVPKLLRHGAAGTVMERELTYFRKLVTHPARPTCVVIGGRSVKEKLLLLRSLIRKVDKVLLAGAVALPFLAAKGLSPGRGFDPSPQLKWNTYDKETISVKSFVTRLLAEANAAGVKIMTPADFVATNEIAFTKTPHITQGGSVPSELYAVDVGPNTIIQYGKEIRDCRTVFWVGTFGFTEVGFREGTETFARILASANVISVVGGGHTAKAVTNAGVAVNISHICSGSVAQLHVLQGLALPGVAALTDVQADISDDASSSINELLRKLPLFAQCSPQQLSSVSRKAVRRAHNLDDFLIYDGDRTTSMHVVAKGALIASPNSALGMTIAQRVILRGHSIGQYEFIGQRPATETVRVSEQDTVTFQITSAAIRDAIAEDPELASQLVLNLTDPLRLEQNRVLAENRTEDAALLADMAAMRKPVPLPLARNGTRRSCVTSFGAQLFAAVATTVVTYQRFTLPLFPYQAQEGTLPAATVKEGLGVKLIHSVAREVAFRYFAQNSGGSAVGLLAAGAGSAMAVSPIRIAAQGTPIAKIQYNDVVDTALLDGAMALAPVAAHGLFLRLRTRAEQSANKRSSAPVKVNHRVLPVTNEIFIAAMCRAIVALLIYPLLVRRNPQTLNLRSLLIYLVKQALSLVVEVIAYRLAPKALL